jgi:hypothetical protein
MFPAEVENRAKVETLIGYVCCSLCESKRGVSESEKDRLHGCVVSAFLHSMW